MKDKTVVITGGTSGLGRATALQLAQKGASVVIVARSKAKANEVIKEIEKEGGKGQSIISELSSMRDTEEAADSIARVVDRLDVLINNAGAHFPKYRETPEGFESTLALNYLSPFLLTHHLIKLMKQTASDYGEYIHHRKIKKSWPPTRDENAQKRLYDVTQSILSEWLTVVAGDDVNSAPELND